MIRFSQTKIFVTMASMVILSISMLSSCSESEDVSPNNNNGQQNDGASIGEDAPNFELSTLNGSTFNMSEQKDKVVVLFFFGSSCPSCRAVGPDIEKKLNADFNGNSGYTIIGLDQWDENSNSVESFKTITKISFPLLLDASQVASSYNTTYDRLVVVDKKGKIAHRGSRGATNDISTVVSLVNDLLDNM